MTKNAKTPIRMADASPNQEPSQPLDANAYKTFDISKAVRQDVQAAVSLLSLILDNPQILDLVVGEIEKIRARVIEQESFPKREDFHPELNITK